MPVPFRRLQLLIAASLIASASSLNAQVVDTVRIGVVNLSYVARTAKAAKSELARIEDATRKKAAEVENKAAALQQQQATLQKSGLGLSPRAVADLQRAFEKSRLELERFQQDAESEISAMQAQFDVRFRARLEPAIDEVSKQKGLHLVFGLEQAAIVWRSPAVDISDDVIKLLDAQR
jgi:Skp family chaperone for outer membrane proteins